jgi:hypothetical protein
MLDGDFDLDITGGYFDVMSPREQERYNKKWFVNFYYKSTHDETRFYYYLKGGH